MLDKKEIRQEMVNYLCGEEGLKDEFIDLLKAGGLSEYEGNIIKNKLLKDIDSNKDLDLMFHEYYLHLYKIYHRIVKPEGFPFFNEDDEVVDLRICEDENDPFNNNNFPNDALKEYRSDEHYLELVGKQFPQSVDEAVDMLIEGLNKDSIVFAKESSKGEFRAAAHFSLAMYARNNFGLNNHKSIDLLMDIDKNGGNSFMADSASGFLMEKVWERIQKDYDEIILSKE